MGAAKSLQMVTAAMKFRYLLLGRKARSNLDRILKSRDITLLTKVPIVKAMGFLGFPGGSAGKDMPAMWETWI